MKNSQDHKSKQTQNLLQCQHSPKTLNFVFSYSKGVLVSELKPGKKYASFIKPIKPPYYFDKESDQAPRPVRVY